MCSLFVDVHYYFLKLTYFCKHKTQNIDAVLCCAVLCCAVLCCAAPGSSKIDAVLGCAALRCGAPGSFVLQTYYGSNGNGDACDCNVLVGHHRVLNRRQRVLTTASLKPRGFSFTAKLCVLLKKNMARGARHCAGVLLALVILTGVFFLVRPQLMTSSLPGRLVWRMLSLSSRRLSTGISKATINGLVY